MFDKFLILKIDFDYLDKIGTDDFHVNSVSDLISPKNNSIIFINKWDDEYLAKLELLNQCLIIIPKINIEKLSKIKNDNLILFSSNPRMEYAIILNKILNKISRSDNYISENGYVIGDSVIIGDNCKINPQVFIDNGVSIGDGCIIHPGVKIRKNVTIGKNSIIRENSVIGGQGFGVEKQPSGHNIQIPHLGGVSIGDYVEIGALTVVQSGTIRPTIIEDYVKIDDHVHFGHNCHAKTGCIITACSEISGSVIINSNVWLGANCSIKQKIEIGENSIIGLGAVVTKDVEKNSTMIGNPAVRIEKYKKSRG